MEYQNVKTVKSKFKSEKSNKNKHESNVVLKENKKEEKRHLNRDVCYMTLNICLLILRVHTCEHYNSFKIKYNCITYLFSCF